MDSLEILDKSRTPSSSFCGAYSVDISTLKEKKNLKFHAILLWTIKDFPAYTMLSGWSTKGMFACPYCHKDTKYMWLKYVSKHCYTGITTFYL
jgi:hypothetical protein